MAFSPIKSLLPGYLKASERSATEESLMRLDSLYDVFDTYKTYVDNFRDIMNDNLSEVKKNEIVTTAATEKKYALDSILTMDAEEEAFMTYMREHERFDATKVAPLDAETINFGSACGNGIISDNTKESIKAEFITEKDGEVGAMADGVVIAVSTSNDKLELSSILIQHKKGFLSRYSHLITPLVKSGDKVISGQVIGMAAIDTNDKTKKIFIEMWHNGNRLIPYEFFSTHQFVHNPIVDVEVGRGKF